MPIPTRAELRAAFAEAMATYPDSTNPSAAIRAAVAVVLPDEVELDLEAPLSELHRQAERYRIQAKFFHLAYSIQGRGASGQERADG
jgi:hypothetical protein